MSYRYRWPLGEHHEGVLRIDPGDVAPSDLALAWDGVDENDTGGLRLIEDEPGDELIAVVPDEGLTYSEARGILGMLQLAGIATAAEIAQRFTGRKDAP